MDPIERGKCMVFMGREWGFVVSQVFICLRIVYVKYFMTLKEMFSMIF